MSECADCGYENVPEALSCGMCQAPCAPKADRETPRLGMAKREFRSEPGYFLGAVFFGSGATFLVPLVVLVFVGRNLAGVIASAAAALVIGIGTLFHAARVRSRSVTVCEGGLVIRQGVKKTAVLWGRSSTCSRRSPITTSTMSSNRRACDTRSRPARVSATSLGTSWR